MKNRHVSNSELYTFSQCEVRHHFKYVLREKGEYSHTLKVGNIVDKAVSRMVADFSQGNLKKIGYYTLEAKQALQPVRSSKVLVLLDSFYNEHVRDIHNIISVQHTIYSSSPLWLVGKPDFLTSDYVGDFKVLYEYEEFEESVQIKNRFQIGLYCLLTQKQSCRIYKFIYPTETIKVENFTFS